MIRKNQLIVNQYTRRIDNSLPLLYNRDMENNERKIIEGGTFDEERALYHEVNAEVKGCTFAGPADGESALKECRRVTVDGCSFSLRYPLWHAEDFCVTSSTMDELTRAALWYCKDGRIEKSYLGGIKALRECDNITLEKCRVVSPEFGWRCRGVNMRDCDVKAEYFLFECKNIALSGVKLNGKYSFQYVDGGTICDCEFNTKDAFWHSKNLHVKNTVLKGEYLGWYSEGLVLENCLISGTQPLCYCKNLTLINCRTEGCDLSFEYSEVKATIDGHIVSIKNPASGVIEVDSVDEIIRGDCAVPCTGEVIVRRKKAANE